MLNAERTMSETFYTSCADVLALCQAEKDNLGALLDAQTGFPPRLRQLCVPRSQHDSRVFSFIHFSRIVGPSRRGKRDASSRTLSELVVVREWLHETAPPPPRPDASTGYWRFTKHRVTQGRWTGNTGRAVENVMREMDPDAVVREAERRRGTLD